MNVRLTRLAYLYPTMGRGRWSGGGEMVHCRSSLCGNLRLAAIIQSTAETAENQILSYQPCTGPVLAPTAISKPSSSASIGVLAYSLQLPAEGTLQ
jgi:hypothetical protein